MVTHDVTAMTLRVVDRRTDTKSRPPGIVKISGGG
jgi:hypothetical protein